MKKILISFILSVALISATFAQDQRTRETRIADAVMQLPAGNTASFNRIMGDLIQLDNVIGDLVLRLTDSGDGDAQLRLAISGLAMYASGDGRRSVVAKSICDAIPRAASDEIRDFLFIQLQFVAGEESVETAAQYLDNVRLADAAARVLVNIGSDAAGRALTSALGSATSARQLTIVQALGDMRYQPARGAITALATTGNANLRKAALYSLAQIADPASEKLLSDAARKAGYRFELTDALGSYVLFLNNSLPAQTKMVTKSARRMFKATSENKQLAAKTAALEILTFSAGENAISDITKALKSSNKQYRQAALMFSTNIGSAKMYNELMKVAQRERRPEVKAEIITAFGERGDGEAIPFLLTTMTDVNGNVRVAAIVAAARLTGGNVVAPIVRAMNTSDEQVVAAGKNTLLAIAGENVVNEAAAAIPQTSSQAKIAFLEILAARRATSQVEVIFSQTTSTDANVRLAAYRALAPVVAENDIPRITQLLNTASNRNEIIALQQALFASVSEKSQEEQTDIITELATRSSNPAKYANVLAMIGGSKALDLVMEHGFNSGNAEMREVAFEALINWSDELGMSQLYRIAADNPSGAYFERALTAYISKIGSSRITSEQRLLLLRNALEIAQSPAHKQTILRQITRTNTFLGLIIAGRYLDDRNTDVQQAAVQTVSAIALANPQYYGPEITALLNKAIAVNRDPEAEYQKQAILNHLADMPNDEGFLSIFNGIDLTGWKGLVEDPIRRARMTPEELARRQARADEIMRRDWTVENGILIFDGPAYDNLCTVRDYGDIEMYIDWRVIERGDAGIYLRGSPQVQIWDDSRSRIPVGSGGLFNNRVHPRNPLVIADNPVGEWNSFYLRMIGEKVTVYLNGQLVADDVILENFWDRNIPIFETGQIELQAHTDRTYYRDIYVREIPRPEPYKVSDEEQAEGFAPMFNGVDLTGWAGDVDNYFVRDGAIVCAPVGHGNMYSEKEYSNFIMRFDFKLTTAANNGIGIRSTRAGDSFRLGWEMQILDDDAEVYRNLQPYQYHGSVYGVIPAKRGGYLKPVGEWNTQEIIMEGYRVKVTLNGNVIVDSNIAEVTNSFTENMGGYRIPGLSNRSGHIGLLAHDAEVAFRNMRIKELSP